MKQYNLIENVLYKSDQLESLGVDYSTLVFLTKNNIIEKINKKYTFKFIGSIFFNEKHIIILPKYRTKPFNEYELSLFHNSLIKFNNTVSIFSTEQQGSNWSEVYEFILDYVKNGFFNRYEKTYNNDWSNPSWDKMFNQSPIYVNNNIFWKEPVSFNTTISSKSLEDLHKQIISFILYTFPIMKNFFPSLNIEKPSLAPNPNILSLLIQSELQRNTLSREKRMLQIANKLINGSKTCNGLILGTKHVHSFWEQLLRNYLNDESYKWLSYFPKATWNIKNKEGNTAAHRPDIIIEREGNIYLYDAKYYDTKETQPGIQDITKQILYEKCLEFIAKGSTIYNGFIFPSDNPNDHYSIETGKIVYNIFANTTIYTHHQYDIELFAAY